MITQTEITPNLHCLDNIIIGLTILRRYANAETRVNEHGDWLDVFQWDGPPLAVPEDQQAALKAFGWFFKDECAWSHPLCV